LGQSVNASMGQCVRGSSPFDIRQGQLTADIDERSFVNRRTQAQRAFRTIRVDER